MDAETDSVHGSGWVNRPAIVYACAFAPDLNQDLLDSPETGQRTAAGNIPYPEHAVMMFVKVPGSKRA